MKAFSEIQQKSIHEDFSSFFNYVAGFQSISTEGQEALKGILIKSTFPKGHLLLREGQVSAHLHFIEKGLAKVYYLKDGKEIVHWLGAENSVAVSITSFLSRKPSLQYIELLESSTIISVPFEALEKLYNQFHEVERFGRLLTGHALILMQQRFEDLHFSTARERYENLLKENPALLQRVPLYTIASFIGISQETLSRIRHL